MPGSDFPLRCGEGETAMSDEEWPLTSKVIADSDRAAQGDYDLTEDDDEPERGMSMLHELALEGRVREYEPGRFYVSKLED
jgi:hypothetical protein